MKEKSRSGKPKKGVVGEVKDPRKRNIYNLDKINTFLNYISRG
jgi:hypothetical protein